MIEIGINKVSKSYGNNEVLRNINFEIKTGDKVSLIGQNGCGKTTLLKMICGEELPTSGEIFIRRGATTCILNQNSNEKWNNMIVKDILYSSFNKVKQLEEMLKIEEEKLFSSSGVLLDKAIKRYSTLQDEFIMLGGYEINSKIEKIVAGLGVSNLIEKKYAFLSGGEKTIINLINVLLQEPDILLLDEPTNHLDINMIEWLENFLNNYKKTVLIVSHDRYFLDSVTNKTILVDNGDSEIFNGNYSYYLNENEKRLDLEFNEYKNQQKKIDAMKKSIKKLREFGRLAYPLGEKFYKRAAAIEKRLEKIELVEKPKKQIKLPIDFSLDKRSGNDVIEFEKMNLYVGEKELLNNAKLFVRYSERVCLIGKNGSGKTTLVKKILSGDSNIKIGSNVKIGYIPQEIFFDDENLNVLEEASKYFNGTTDLLRSALYRFMFGGEMIKTKLKYLSGGERLRLKLFCIMQNNANLLILDEPTNHIDINTKEVLEEAINNYNGTVLVISHDRYFINKIATRIVIIENKSLVSYIGNYDDYKNALRVKNNL